MDSRSTRARRSTAVALATILMGLCALAGPALALDPARDPVRILDDPEMAHMRRAQLMREAFEERRERRAYAREAARLRRRAPRPRPVAPAPGPGTRMTPAAGEAAPPATRALSPAALAEVAGIPTNVLVNNKSGNASNAAQAEQSVALLGNNGLCAWNNGQGYVTGGDTQGAAYTTNGGSTWTTVSIPHPAGAVANFWYTDPVVTVNEKTGEFWYLAVTRPNGIAIIKATFSGSTFTWGTPKEIRKDATSALLFDKPWLAADSLTGNLYLTYTVFGAYTDSILFQRSTDKGLSWSSPMLMNVTDPSFGGVQGSRPAVGDSGEVYVVWQELGFIDVDYLKLRKSWDRGLTFAPEDTIATEFSNAGSGAPGFNRPNGFTFPSIAVDRTTGTWRGRVYVAWNESADYFDDPLGSAGAQSEIEGNGTFGTATAFTPGQKLRGSVSNGDVDIWSFSATQGTSYIFYCDSIPAPPTGSLNYEMRIVCTNQVTQLAYGGSTDPGFVSQKSVLFWTAPADGIYYLRFRQLTGVGNYRIQTGIDLPTAGQHARDQRDAIVIWANKGVMPWSAPVRMNAEKAYYDDWLPEVAVGADGYVYGLWYDWRDAVTDCAGSSQTYLGRSTNGGASWQGNAPVTSSPTHWTTTGANIAPNQGDYTALGGTARLMAAWADGRLGDVDVYSALIPVDYQLTKCRADTSVIRGRLAVAWWNLANLNPVFDNVYTLTLSNARNWPMPPGGTFNSGPLTVKAGTTLGLYREFLVPDTAAVGGQNTFCLTVTTAGGSKTTQCCFKVTILQGTTDAIASSPAGPALRGAWPNPASNGLHVAFTLVQGAPASLELLDLAGRRLLARDVTALGAGAHVLDLSREAAGLRPGVYTVRLIQSGRALTSKVAIVR